AALSCRCRSATGRPVLEEEGGDDVDEAAVYPRSAHRFRLGLRSGRRGGDHQRARNERRRRLLVAVVPVAPMAGGVSDAANGGMKGPWAHVSSARGAR